MRRGPWHQFGHNSQRLALEQLDHECGVGVIISPRDLAYDGAIRYADMYHAKGADVLIDQQFYVPDFTNAKLDSYPVRDYRTTVSQLCQIGDSGLAGLARQLETINGAVSADAVLAPAVPYEGGRPDLVDLNTRLFAAARGAGDALGIPTYATVVLGRSVASTSETLTTALSHATSLESDGWYFGFEFAQERIPSSQAAVLRCCAAGLMLACTGKPVLHAYAGPMALLAMGWGATGAGIGHFQNLWHYAARRWQASAGDGGGGDAPARFFSAGLWGTIVYPDEVRQLPREIRDRLLTESPFSGPVAAVPPGSWSRWDANKHLVHVICSTVADIARDPNPQDNANVAIRVLERAVALHADIARTGLTLGDDTNAYQYNWLSTIRQLLTSHLSDFEYLRLVSPR